MAWLIRLLWIWRGSVASRGARAAAARLRALAASAPAGFPGELRGDLSVAASRLEAAEIRIVVGGLFKAGKSTFLNGLVQENLLPSADLAETGAPAWLRRGRQAAAVSYADGRLERFEASRDAIAARSSIRGEDGRPRPIAGLATRVDVWTPLLRIPRYATLIDIPGLNDRPELSTLAREVLRNADWVLWLFRSEPAFSEQDAEVVAGFAPHLDASRVTFILNARLEEDDEAHWSRFMESRAPIAHEALCEHTALMGIGNDPPLPLVVSARAFANGRAGFGAPEVGALLRGICRERPRSLMRARFAFAAGTLQPAREWTEREYAAARRNYDEHLAAHQAFLDGRARRAKLVASLDAAVHQTFETMRRQLGGLPLRHAGGVTPSSYTPGKEYGEGLAIDTANLVALAATSLSAEAARQARDLLRIDGDAEGTARIVRSFAPGEIEPAEDSREALQEAVAQEVASLTAPSIERSMIETIKRWFGNDEALKRTVEALQHDITCEANRITAILMNQAPAVRAAVQAAFPPPPLREVSSPDRGRLAQLEAFRDQLARLTASIEKQAR